MSNRMRRWLVLVLIGSVLALPVSGVGAETVLITGANTGIGLEFARQYAERGWNVVATHRRDGTPQTLRELEEAYPNVRAERMDVTRHEEIEALAIKLEGMPVDVLINNASLKRFAPLTDREGNAGQIFRTLDYEHFDQFMRTNVAGALKVAEAFIDHVVRSDRKQIINLSSRAGMITEPGNPDHFWYRTSKTALNQSMRLVAESVRDDGVTVVMFHPGGVQTESFGDVLLEGALTPTEAVGRLVRVIDSLSIEHTGRFLDNQGKDHPW